MFSKLAVNHDMEIQIDFESLNDIREMFKLTDKQFNASLKRAVSRTAGSARSAISKEKLGISDLRRTTAIRKRVKPLQRSTGIWIGINDLWASEFKGRPRRTPTGIDFRGKHFEGAFLMRPPNSKRNQIMIKRSDGKIEKLTIPIADKALKYLEKHVLPDLPEKLFHHFKTDVEFRKQVGNFYRLK